MVGQPTPSNTALETKISRDTSHKAPVSVVESHAVILEEMGTRRPTLDFVLEDLPPTPWAVLWSKEKVDHLMAQMRQRHAAIAQTMCLADKLSWGALHSSEFGPGLGRQARQPEPSPPTK
jgi:hypothetical protein